MYLLIECQVNTFLWFYVNLCKEYDYMYDVLPAGFYVFTLVSWLRQKITMLIHKPMQYKWMCVLCDCLVFHNLLFMIYDLYA